METTEKIPAMTEMVKYPLIQTVAPYWTEDILIEGIVRGHGIPAEICRWLTARHGRKASKSMFFRKLKEFPSLREKILECKSTLFDVCMLGIAERASCGIPQDQRFLASKLGPEMGWFKSKDGAAEGRASLEQQVDADGEITQSELTDEQIALLTDSELRALIAAEDAKDNARRRQAALSESTAVAGG